MKKRLSILFLLLILFSKSFADTFIDAIQDLAMYTACIGTYSMSETGHGGWYDDPHDYYTVQMIASRLAQESGRMTRTSTFYGICFDYAQFAYQYIERNKSWYNNHGMYERQFWIAGTDSNSKIIELQYPSDEKNYTIIQNGVYVKRPSTEPFRTVTSHKNAIHHAWIWIQRADGVWFWIDPT